MIGVCDCFTCRYLCIRIAIKCDIALANNSKIDNRTVPQIWRFDYQSRVSNIEYLLQIKVAWNSREVGPQVKS
jgi:hypothetical protein